MENKDTLFEALKAAPIALGAYKTGIIDAREISLDCAFRAMCEANSCGMYGRCWMCPPDVGDIDVLISEVAEYDYALVYQTVTSLEDSFDFEGMIEAKKRTYPIAQKLRDVFRECGVERVLHLGAGGCGVCETCSRRTNEPCRYPERAMPSLEAYGVNVSRLADAAGMRYINGQDTVTYFGAVLFSLDGEKG